MTTPAGLILPTIKSYSNGTGNPKDSAMMSQQEMNRTQNNLNNSVGGKRRKYRIKKNNAKGGATSNEIPAPQLQMLYTPQGGPGTNPNDQIKDISTTSTQAAAWKASDSLASKMTGGRKKSRQKLKRRKNKNKTKKRRFTK